MTISPQDAERLADGLRTTFSNLEGILLERIARRLGNGTASPNWRDDKLAQVQIMKNEVSEIVDKFTKGMNGYVEKAIEKAFEMGKNGADMDVLEAKRQGYDGQAVRNLQLLTATSATVAPMNTLAISALVAEATGAIDGMKFNILRKSEDAYRQVIARTSTAVLSGAETKLQAVQRSINEFADSGITGFVDKAGRNWNIGSYSDMAVRTAVGRAAMAGHELRLGQLEHDLVIVSQHPDECPLCRQYEGKIFSLTGASEKYPPLAVARAGGLFHCNCGHVATAYFEGFTSPMPQKIGKATDYEEKQKQRAIERQIRKWKNREAVALTPEERKKAEAKRKEWQLAMREFIKDTGRRRKPEREVINFGAKPEPNRFKTVPLKTEVKKPENPKKQAKPKKEAKPKTQKQEPPDKSAVERQREADVAEFKRRIAESDVIERSGGKAYVDEITRKFGEADEDARRVFLNYYDSSHIHNVGTGALLEANGQEIGAHWQNDDKKIYMNYKDDTKKTQMQSIGETFFHEVGHMIDNVSITALYNSGAIDNSRIQSTIKLRLMYCRDANPERADKLVRLIKKEAQLIVDEATANMEKRRLEVDAYIKREAGGQWNLTPKKKESIKKKVEKLFINYEMNNLLRVFGGAGVADVVSGAFECKYYTPFGHKKSYWQKSKYKLLTEAWANFYEAQFQPEAKAEWLKRFPKTYAIFMDMLKELR